MCFRNRGRSRSKYRVTWATSNDGRSILDLSIAERSGFNPWGTMPAIGIVNPR